MTWSAELEANGRSLQHFARELARSFPQSAGGEDRRRRDPPGGRIAGRAADDWRRPPQPFSEEDLTRYLQLSLDLFRDLQSSLQPRLHLEMGLLRMVQAGRLVPIEEALAGLSGRGARRRAAAPPKAAATVPHIRPVLSPPGRKPPPKRSHRRGRRPASGDLRSRLHAALLEAKLTHLADAVEHSELAESPNELVFTTPKMYQLYLKQPEFEAAAKRIAGRPVRITIKVGEAAPRQRPSPRRRSARMKRQLARSRIPK